jgi:hypothetical protein
MFLGITFNAGIDEKTSASFWMPDAYASFRMPDAYASFRMPVY